MTMVTTVLEASVAPERVADLERAFAEAAAGPFPPGFIRSALLRDANDAMIWRIETVWESFEALAAMRGAGKPRGIQMFEAAGAVPSLRIFNTAAEISPLKISG